MHQDQSITLSLGSQPGADDSLARTRWCSEDTDILFTQHGHGLLLDGREFAIEPYIQAFTGMALIIDSQCAAVLMEQVGTVPPATAGQGNVPRKSSAQLITRGVNAVDSRMLCFL